MTTNSQDGHNGLLLAGLDGSNPLAFLAALGTLRTLNLAWPQREVRMSWTHHGGAWRPQIHIVPCAQRDELADVLYDHLCTAGQASLDARHLELGKNLSVPPAVFRKHAQAAAAAACPNDRRWADFTVSFGSDVLVHPRLDRIDYTEFCFLAGSGHQNYLETIKKLANTATVGHLRSALFDPWVYEDDKLSMRWDPAEAREYAYRWGDPSDESTHTVWGANLLAFEGTLMYPTVPTAHGLPTAGFARDGGRLYFTWPIWELPIGTDIVQSLVCHPEMRQPSPNRALYQDVGVSVIWRCEKVRIGEAANYKWNFRPAQAL